MATWNERNEQHLSKIYPVLATRVRAYILDVGSQGVPILIIRGLATFPEQNALYAQGRTAPGPRVTKARAGYSGHNFGLAVDVAPDDIHKPGLQLDWDGGQPEWKIIVESAERHGLNSGATFGDRPHLYLKELRDTPTDEMRTAFVTSGLPAVWKLVDEKLGSEG